MPVKLQKGNVFSRSCLSFRWVHMQAPRPPASLHVPHPPPYRNLPNRFKFIELVPHCTGTPSSQTCSNLCNLDLTLQEPQSPPTGSNLFAMQPILLATRAVNIRLKCLLVLSKLLLPLFRYYFCNTQIISIQGHNVTRIGEEGEEYF